MAEKLGGLGETARWEIETSIAVEPGKGDGFMFGVSLMAGFRAVGSCRGGVGSGLSRVELDRDRDCDIGGPRMVRLLDKSTTSPPFLPAPPPAATSPTSLMFITCDSPSSSIRSLLARPGDGAIHELFRLNEPKGVRKRLPLPPGELSRRIGRLSEDREGESVWEDVRLRAGTASTEWRVNCDPDMAS